MFRPIRSFIRFRLGMLRNALGLLARGDFEEFARRARLRNWFLAKLFSPRRLRITLRHINERVDVNSLVTQINTLWETSQGCEVVAEEKILEPAVSIVIPVFGNLIYTLNCIRSIVEHRTKYTYEIIVMDDCSPDRTWQVLPGIGKLIYLRSPYNEGFGAACNRGAAAARGRYVVFLNNDTLMLPGWLDELADTFDQFPDAGLVGSKLLYPNGLLQEAGCIVRNDGSAENYGRGDSPFRPEYNYAREVDYCSGASIMLPRELFLQLGGFDARYAPVYCEDSDLAFRVRKLGSKVVYQPLSSLIHYEGTTCGRDVSWGLKAYQTANAKKFFDRWKKDLACHGPAGSPSLLEKDRNVNVRVLIIDHRVPTPDQDSGSVTAFQMMKIFRSLGFGVTFVPADMMPVEGYVQDLQRRGVEVVCRPYVRTIKRHLKVFGTLYHLVVLSRFNAGGRFIDDVRQHCPKAKILFDTVDLHHIREMRQAELKRSNSSLKRAEASKQEELAIAGKADMTLVVSSHELEILKTEIPNCNVRQGPPLILDVPSTRADLAGRGFADRADICFIGGFEHKPNVDAVHFFVKQIWPLILRKLPDSKFFVIGSKPPKSISALTSKHDRIVVTGYVADLGHLLCQLRLSVAPLRYGSGVKGKIGMSCACGVPCVATSLAAEGMGLTPHVNIVVADEPHTFADAVVRVYTQESLWTRLSVSGRAFVETQYSPSAARDRLIGILADLGVPSIRS